jgi:metal-sulfur cluster biosynthetic enzyme
MKSYSEQELMDILRPVEDPELGYSIVDLGLVYRAEQVEDGIEVDFTLTSPACPLGEQLRTDIVLTLKKATGVSSVRTNVVWKPRWSIEAASDALRLELGYPIW